MTRTRRLLLIAMSGLRIHSDELRSRGMTLPGFLERGRVIASLPSLGLLTLAAHTPANWEIDYRELEDVPPSIDGHYDLVAISSLSARILEAYALADRLRAEGVTVVLGGLHTSALPDEAALHADAVVVGQGEAVWEELLKDVEDGRLRPRYGPRPFSLSQARVPRYDLLEISRYDRLTLQTVRGCPLDCAFCGASRTISAFQRKPIEQVRREIEAILSIWPRPFIELADDNTFVHKAWGKELVRLLEEYDLHWFTETDLSVADDGELLDLLAGSGCAQLLIGLESAHRASLVDVDGRRWKHGQHPHYVEKIRRIQSRGITVNGCFVVGFDEDDAGVFARTLDLARDCRLAEVQITVLTPFPGTPLNRRLEAEERLLSPIFWDRCTLFDVTYRPARMSVPELEAGFADLMDAMYGAQETAARRTISRDCRRKAVSGRRLHA